MAPSLKGQITITIVLSVLEDLLCAEHSAEFSVVLLLSPPTNSIKGGTSIPIYK